MKRRDTRAGPDDVQQRVYRCQVCGRRVLSEERSLGEFSKLALPRPGKRRTVAEAKA